MLPETGREEPLRSPGRILGGNNKDIGLFVGQTDLDLNACTPLFFRKAAVDAVTLLPEQRVTSAAQAKAG